eukprot:scpid57923/ scgid7353/ 
MARIQTSCSRAPRSIVATTVLLNETRLHEESKLVCALCQFTDIPVLPGLGLHTLSTRHGVDRLDQIPLIRIVHVLACTSLLKHSLPEQAESRCLPSGHAWFMSISRVRFRCVCVCV